MWITSEVQEVQTASSLCLRRNSLFSPSLSSHTGGNYTHPGHVAGRAKSPLMAWKPLWHNPRPQKGTTENRKSNFSCLCWEQCLFLTSVFPGTLPSLTAVLPYLQSHDLLSHDSCQLSLVLVFSLFVHSFIIQVTNTVVVIPQHTLPSSGT